MVVILERLVGGVGLSERFAGRFDDALVHAGQ
jgi:hypothetical protein